MTLADLQPDVALKALLDGKVEVQTSNGTMVALNVYANGEHGNMDADSEYIEILYNGNPNDVTADKSLWNGQLALYLQCKLLDDTRINTKRMRLLMRQIEPLVHRKDSLGYFFKFSPRPITPLQRNYSTGYAYVTYSVAWHIN